MHRPADEVAIAGLRLGGYPERKPGLVGPWQGMLGRVARRVTELAPTSGKDAGAFLRAVSQATPRYVGLDASGLQVQAMALRAELSHRGLTDALLAQAFGLIREVCFRYLGLRPFDTQLMAARVMLRNQLAEMATGEGKTLAAAVCAATAAMAGIPVHVVTVNDYLVARDAHKMQAVFHALGLTVGHVVARSSAEQRHHAYRCDITYCTAKELAFDYLRDRLARVNTPSGLALNAVHFKTDAQTTPTTLLRGLCMAVVDEADSVLIDEARVPLILSKSSGNAGEMRSHAQALTTATRLVVGDDVVLHQRARTVELTDLAKHKLQAWGGEADGVWLNRAHREESVCMALVALHCYQPGRDYLVQRGKVHIIDESTGRLATGRVWSRGLQQLIEIKEGCQPSSHTVPAVQITFQRFFGRYYRLCGMSGTLHEARAELHEVYGLRVEKVPLQRPDQRHVLPTTLVPTKDAMWCGVAQQVKLQRAQQRPVLIGTDSVADSEELSVVLTAQGVMHQVLNAKYDDLEATVVAQAGQAGRVTVATNMAGRGTDIVLGEGVAQRGGLHVISCQYNSSGRIDRQLIGRCARQGDPGSAQSMVSLDHPLLQQHPAAVCLRFIGLRGPVTLGWLGHQLLRLPQFLEDRRQRVQRRYLMAQDTRAQNSLFESLRSE